MTRLLEPLLEDLRRQILRMASLAEAILDKAIRAVLERDATLAGEVRSDDLAIDRIDVAIDTAVLELLARQSPVAAELRQVFAIKTMATDLERIGDLARNIAKSGLRFAERARVELPPRLLELCGEARRILKMALDSFAETDTEKARAVLDLDDRIDELEARLITETIAEIEANPATAPQRVDMILIAKNLERVADHATNIAEEVILAAEALNLKHASKLRA